MLAESAIDKISLHPESIQFLIDHLRKSTKINVKCYKQKFLERKIKTRIHNLNLKSDKEYFEYILRTPSEFNNFSNFFTVNYTYFFRNYEVYQALMSDFLNRKIKRNNQDVLRIWSAPCSTGEEPYSLAMMFDYLKRYNKNIPDIEIFASDIDINAINMAKKGKYGNYSIHELPIIYKSYFTGKKSKLSSKHIINDEIKKKVTFIQEDLIEGHQFNQKYDIIFCRNFLIYLNQNSQRKVLKMMSEHLISQGLLVVGKTEMILDSVSKDFRLSNPKVHFYLKYEI
ncbi:MAG: CheR family methyltransferase [Promethearchaeota archaeon]